jgi:hypothetical protein
LDHLDPTFDFWFEKLPSGNTAPSPTTLTVIGKETAKDEPVIYTSFDFEVDIAVTTFVC